jgi:hypothetical protein
MVEGLTYIEGPPSMNLLFCSLSLFSCLRCAPLLRRPSPPHTGLPRGGAVVARRAHNPKAGGSNPSPATNTTTKQASRQGGLFCCPVPSRLRGYLKGFTTITPS